RASLSMAPKRSSGSSLKAVRQRSAASPILLAASSISPRRKWPALQSGANASASRMRSAAADLSPSANSISAKSARRSATRSPEEKFSGVTDGQDDDERAAYDAKSRSLQEAFSGAQIAYLHDAMNAHDLLRPRPEGLYCPPGDFYIDPVRPVGRALITHGHADHARAGNGSVLATRETLDIM